ncbi:hypothetical protein KEJ15_01055 [Candidatus Bathyarchaeota archaeon]|nr:hypothetical protein [Candidatus Bathyarchaeota archaeon]
MVFQRQRAILPLVILVISIFFCAASATTAQFVVHAGGEASRILNLAVDDHVLIDFSVIGQSVHTLRFYLACPNGTVIDFGETADFNYRFVCVDAGNYTMKFSNSDSVEDKLVTLNYEIEHYLFGLPQMLFLAVVVAVLCVAAVAVFILMGKPH